MVTGRAVREGRPPWPAPRCAGVGQELPHTAAITRAPAAARALPDEAPATEDRLHVVGAEPGIGGHSAPHCGRRVGIPDLAGVVVPATDLDVVEDRVATLIGRMPDQVRASVLLERVAN